MFEPCSFLEIQDPRLNIPDRLSVLFALAQNFLLCCIGVLIAFYLCFSGVLVVFQLCFSGVLIVF